MSFVRKSAIATASAALAFTAVAPVASAAAPSDDLEITISRASSGDLNSTAKISVKYKTEAERACRLWVLPSSQASTAKEGLERGSTPRTNGQLASDHVAGNIFRFTGADAGKGMWAQTNSTALDAWDPEWITEVDGKFTTDFTELSGTAIAVVAKCESRFNDADVPEFVKAVAESTAAASDSTNVGSLDMGSLFGKGGLNFGSLGR